MHWQTSIHVRVQKCTSDVDDACNPSLQCCNAQYLKDRARPDCWRRQVIVERLVLLITTRYKPRLKFLKSPARKKFLFEKYARLNDPSLFLV